MSNQIAVNFKVSGAELSSYIDTISRKSTAQANEAIKNATAQTDQSKKQLQLINETITALEKKTRLETQAARSLLLEGRESALSKNRDYYEGKKNDVFSNTKLSEDQKKEKLNALSGIERENEQRIKSEYRDNLTVLREQERQAKLQTQLSKEQIDTVKQTARENVKAINAGDLKLSDVINKAATDEERLIAKLTEEGLREEKKRHEKERGSGGNMLDAVLKGELIRSTGEMVGGIPQSKNELDFVKPMTSLLGMAIGGAIGTGIDLANVHLLGTGLGQTTAGTIGMEIGKTAGEFIGGSLERAYSAREDLTNKNYALQALTGINYGVDGFGSANNGLGGTGKSSITGNLSKYGLDYSQTADLQLQLAQKQGSAFKLGEGAEDIASLEKGLGISRESIFNIVEIPTKGKREFFDVITGILNAGKGGIFKEDRALFSEFLGRYSQITKEFLKSQTTLGNATSFDVVNKFDSLGGEFSVADSRASGLITSINNSLVNPNTDFKKALSFYALRKSSPNMSMADLIEEQQKGLSSENYFNSMLDLTDSMGGSESDKRLQFAGMFGLEGQQKFASDLYTGYKDGKFGRKMMQGQLKRGMSPGDVRNLAESQVGQYTKSTAEIQNMFVDDVAGAVAGVGDKMRILFGSMIDELETFIVGKIKGSTSSQQKTLIHTNITKKPYSGTGFNPAGGYQPIAP